MDPTNWLELEEKSRPQQAGDTRQPLSFKTAGEHPWLVAIAPGEGNKETDVSASTPSKKPFATGQGLLLTGTPKGRLEAVSAAAFVGEQFGEAFRYVPEVHMESILLRYLGREAYEAARLMASLIPEVQGEGSPPLPAGGKAASLLFLGILCTVSTAGQGVAMLVRLLLYRCSFAAAEARLRGAIRGCLFEADVIRSFLACVRVLFRFTECGPEVQPLHDAIEAELQRLELLPRNGSGGTPSPPHPDGQPGASGPGGVTLTAEQQAACRPTFRDAAGKPLINIVQAFAGAAKTTILRAMIRHFPDIFFLYIVFNKDAQEAAVASIMADLEEDLRAGRKRTVNFEVRTSHSLAHNRFGVYTRYRGREFRDLLLKAIKDLLVEWWAPAHPRHVTSAVTSAVRRTLNKYMASAEAELGEEHLQGNNAKQLQKMDEALSNMLWRKDGVDPRTKGPALHPEYSREMVVDAARRLWEDVQQPLNNKQRLPHNAYLKAYALSPLTLAASAAARPVVILVDEAQDINAVTKQVLVDKQEVPVVLVGDKYQQIYSFNFACGLMAGRAPLPPREVVTQPLRQTFRFGHEITAAVNAILKAAYLEPNYMVGRSRDTPNNAGHPGVVYALLPQDKDLTTVRAEDVSKPKAKAKAAAPVDPAAPGPSATRKRPSTAAAAGGDFSGMRYVQCPLRRTFPDAEFPEVFDVTPLCGVALIPPGFQLPPCCGSKLKPLPLLMHVARTNAALVRAALELVAAGRSVCASFRAEAWDNILRLLKNVIDFLAMPGPDRFPPDHELHGLHSEQDLVELVEAEAGGDLATAYALAKEYTLAQVSDLGNKLVRDRTRAEYYLVTSHKAKGDEALVVQVAEDYTTNLAPTSEDGAKRLAWQRSDPTAVDELNCVYVAATRARCILLLNRDLTRLVLGLHRKHVALVPPPPQQQQQQPREAQASAAVAAAVAAAGCPGPSAAVAVAVTPGPSPGSGRQAQVPSPAPSPASCPLPAPTPLRASALAAPPCPASCPPRLMPPGPSPQSPKAPGPTASLWPTAATSPIRQGAPPPGPPAVSSPLLPAPLGAAPTASSCEKPSAAPASCSPLQAAPRATSPASTPLQVGPPPGAASAAATPLPGAAPAGTPSLSGPTLATGAPKPSPAGAREPPSTASTRPGGTPTGLPPALGNGASGGERSRGTAAAVAAAAGGCGGRPSEGGHMSRPSRGGGGSDDDSAILIDDDDDDNEDGGGSAGGSASGAVLGPSDESWSGDDEEEDEEEDKEEEDEEGNLSDASGSDGEDSGYPESDDSSGADEVEEEEDEEEDEEDDSEEEWGRVRKRRMGRAGGGTHRPRSRRRMAEGAPGADRARDRSRRDSNSGRARKRGRRRRTALTSDGDGDGGGAGEQGAQPGEERRARRRRGGAVGTAAAPSCAVCCGPVVDHPQAQLLPRVTWHGQPVCRSCARRTVFGQVLELAEARLERQQRQGQGGQ